MHTRYLSFSVTTQHRNFEQVPFCFISLKPPQQQQQNPNTQTETSPSKTQKLKEKNLQTPHPNRVLFTQCIFQPRKLVFYFCEGIKDKARAFNLSYSKLIRTLVQILLRVPDSHSS